MKKIVGFLDGLGYELDRFGQAPPAIGQKGSVAWGNEHVEGFKRIEGINGEGCAAHIFSDWDEGLEGFWAEAPGTGSTLSRRWVCAARPGTGTSWLKARMDEGFDALAGARGQWIGDSVEWSTLSVAEADRFLWIKLRGEERAVHAKNVMMILEKQHESVRSMVEGHPHWIFGRAAVEVGGRLVPVLNASKASWESAWDSGHGIGGAIVMPYLLKSGALVSWCALLEASPKRVSRKALDEQAQSGGVLFANERALLSICLS